MKIELLVFLFLLLAFLSCKNASNSKPSESEIWRLGWRMTESFWEGKNEIAESQFDSLLATEVKLDPQFLKTGIFIKDGLDKTQEIDQIFSRQSKATLNTLCLDEFLKEYEACAGQTMEPIGNPELQLELIKMFINDQYVRSNLMTEMLTKYNLTKKEVIQDSLGLNTDTYNRTRLQGMIKEFGFPTRELVGKDAMDAVFYIIQHADMDKVWQKSQLPNIEQAVKKGDMDGDSYAYLYDRIRVNSGEKQLYGTQFANVDPVNKTVELAETEDYDKLDERRMKIGMMPIEMYKRLMLKNL